MSEAWVLLKRAAGDVTCCKLGVGPVGTVLGLVGGVKNWGAGAFRLKAAGDRLR